MPSPLHNQSFRASTYRYLLKGQHRVSDSDYLTFLDHIQYWISKRGFVARSPGRTSVVPRGSIRSTRVIQAFEANPECTILIFTNAAANSLNSLITSTAFKNEQPLGYFQLDSSDTDITPIYKGMRVMITQNCDKTQNVVNRQMANVEMCQYATVIFRLPDKLVATYPVTSQCGSIQKTVYPFHLGYENTMCKAM